MIRPVRAPGICGTCSKVMTAEEIEFYGNTCEMCERISHEALDREGLPDPEPRTDIPSIEAICDRLKIGEIVLNQAIYWLHMHAQRQK